jgi:hypothetical protein
MRGLSGRGWDFDLDCSDHRWCLSVAAGRYLHQPSATSTRLCEKPAKHLSQANSPFPRRLIRWRRCHRFRPARRSPLRPRCNPTSPVRLKSPGPKPYAPRPSASPPGGTRPRSSPGDAARTRPAGSPTHWFRPRRRGRCGRWTLTAACSPPGPAVAAGADTGPARHASRSHPSIVHSTGPLSGGAQVLLRGSRRRPSCANAGSTAPPAPSSALRLLLCAQVPGEREPAV